jgi:Arc/MetJ family transcription regulator
MRTNIDLNDYLINEAIRLTKIKTKKEIVNLALEEFVTNCKKKNLTEIKGKIKFADNYDYKTLRQENT